MKRFLTYIWVFVGLLMGAVMPSCKSNSSTTPKSNVAQVTAFYLSRDSFPALARVAFTVSEGTEVGRIYNVDSVPYDCRLALDSCVPRFSFAATPGKAVLYQRDTTLNLTGSDTLCFLYSPDTLEVTSADGTVVKRYRMDVNWHHADPDLFCWKQLSSEVHDLHAAQQRFFVMPGGEFLLYVNDGISVRLYRSENEGATWSEATISGLPASTRVESILLRISSQASSLVQFFYVDGKTIYTSEDGLTWQSDALATSYSILAGLFCFPTPESSFECPWFVMEGMAADSLMLGYIDESHAVVPVRCVARGEFPVSGFSAFRFVSTSNRFRTMVFGGYSVDGEMLNTRFNLEYSNSIGLRMTDYTATAAKYPRIANSAVVWYNKQLLLFGAVDSSYEYVGRRVYCSKDEGMHWEELDSTKCVLPASYDTRKNVCAEVSGPYVYVLGGKDNVATYSDVYKGYVNSVAWSMNE